VSFKGEKTWFYVGTNGKPSTPTMWIFHCFCLCFHIIEDLALFFIPSKNFKSFFKKSWKHKKIQEFGADFNFLDIYKCPKNTFPEITFEKKSETKL
jgi:hypothetical protein